MKYGIALGVVLFGVWLLWSGHFDALLVGFGLASTVAIVLIARRMRILDSEAVPLEITLRALRYAPWLAWEIVKSNLDVARRILDPRLPIDPCVVEVRAGQRRELARVVYANSITLTPGTVSVALEGDTIMVHALTREAAAALESGEMDRRVSAVEGRS